MTFFRETDYQTSPVGKVPSDWEVKKLTEVADYINGYGFSPNEWENSGLPIIRIQNLTNPTSDFNYFKGKIDDRYLVKNGDLLFAWSASIGCHLWDRGDAWLNQHIFKVVPKQGVDRKYLYYALFTAIEQLKQRVHGSTMQHFKRGELEKTFLPLPSENEQRAIVGVLGVVDSAIELADRVIAKTERLKRGLMQQLLAHGIGHTEYKQTPIGKMPQQWNVVKFEELILKLKRGPSKQTNNKEIGVVYLTSDYITDNGFLKFENLKYLDENLVDDVGKYLLEQNDLIVNCVNSFEKIGKVAVFEGFSKRVAIGFNNFALTLEKSVDPLFLKYILSQELYKAIFQSIGKAAVQQVSFSSKDLFRVQVPLPPTILEQRKIAEILSSVDNKIQIEKIQKANLEQIKKGMMGLLLTGKIRIKVD